jgi:hypothetical protein
MEGTTYSLLTDGPDAYFNAVRRLADEVEVEICSRFAGIITDFRRWMPEAESVTVSPREHGLELLVFGVLCQVYGDSQPSRGLEEVKHLYDEGARLARWRHFFHTVPTDKRADCLAEIHRLAAWFTERSLQVLGPCTSGVEAFLQGKHIASLEPRDAQFCGRNRVEYHLNMVGAELLNRAFRQAFLQCRKRLVFLPACMCVRTEKDCQAMVDGPGAQCHRCTPGCRIRHLAELGDELGFTVCVVAHASQTLTPAMAAQFRRDGVGVVGVACLLHLIAGGWLLQDEGIPAQCVPLNHSGCQHWLPKPRLTDFDLQELGRILRWQAPPDGSPLGLDPPGRGRG